MDSSNYGWVLFTAGVFSASLQKQIRRYLKGSADANVLPCVIDHYGGVNIEPSVNTSVEAFDEALRNSVAVWKSKSKRGVWLRLKSPAQIGLASVAVANHGFDMHSVGADGGLLLSRWLPEGVVSSLPIGPSYYLGVGVVCVSKAGKILAVQEANGWTKGKGYWKIVTGLADPGEAIEAAALRELKEETGVTGRFKKVIGMRQGRGTLGKGDIFVVCLVEPLSEDLTAQPTEIAQAAWLDLDAFFKQEWLARRPPLYVLCSCSSFLPSLS
jgi:8-oxo-dGTP pyrophosphatase MutT (NUDIX family)